VLCGRILKFVFALGYDMVRRHEPPNVYPCLGPERQIPRDGDATTIARLSRSDCHAW
jgi:hypothetical protein